MTSLWWGWGITTALFAAVVLAAGHSAQRTWLGALVDSRGRYSLSRLQFLLWMLLVLPLVAGVFVGRLTARSTNPFDFTIPAEVLGVIGISIGSTAIATAVKARKDSTRTAFIAASPPGGAVFAQLFLVEEGPEGDRSIDLTKLQQLLITILLVFAYAASTIHTFLGYGAGGPIAGSGDITTLPSFGATFLILLGVSHAGYLAGKVPNKGELPVEDSPGYTVANRRQERLSEPRIDRKAAMHRDAETRREELRKSRELVNASADKMHENGGEAVRQPATQQIYRAS